MSTGDRMNIENQKKIRALASILFKNTLYTKVFHLNGDPTFNESVWFLIN
jgi:hypothetical protein